MEICSNWLNQIKIDIKNKHGNVKPDFYVDECILWKITFDEFLKAMDSAYQLWLKYKKIDKNLFELKPGSPDPEDKMSTHIIDKFLEQIDYVEGQTYFTVNKYFKEFIEGEKKFTGYFVWRDLPGETYYTKGEIRIELRYLLRQGYSKIELKDTTKLDDGKLIYHLHVDVDKLQNMLKTGYLKLEYSED